MYRFRATVAIPAVAASGTATLTVTETRNGPAQPGTETKQSDIVIAQLSNAAVVANPGLRIGRTHVVSEGVIQIVITNVGGGALTANNSVINIAVLR